MNITTPPPARPLAAIDPATWADVAVPRREWIVQNLVPSHTVTLLTGDGAAGKTTLALQLAAARSLDRGWIGTMPSPGRTLVLSAEDDADEPISALYEQGKVSHVGTFSALEDQMCSFTSDFDRNRAGYSPDRLDALVWCLTELMTTHRTETKTSTIMGLI